MANLKIISFCIACLLAACGDSIYLKQIERISPPSEILDGNGTEVTEATQPSVTFNGLHALPDSKPIIVIAPPYMLSDLSPHYAALFIGCRIDGSIDVNVRQSWAPIYQESNGAIVLPTGEVDMRVQIGKFWDSNVVYFDGVKTPMPMSMSTIAKQVHVGNNKYETRSERILTDPNETINTMLLPKLKSSKTMRLESNNGIGPTFELDDIKGDIEKLEAQCTPAHSER
jgi:hypothetical protein